MKKPKIVEFEGCDVCGNRIYCHDVPCAVCRSDLCPDCANQYKAYTGSMTYGIHVQLCKNCATEDLYTDLRGVLDNIRSIIKKYQKK